MLYVLQIDAVANFKQSGLNEISGKEIRINDIDIKFLWIYELSSTNAFRFEFASLGLDIFFVIYRLNNLFYEGYGLWKMESETWNKFQ